MEKINIVWLPGHYGEERNERANASALEDRKTLASTNISLKELLA